MKRYKINEIFYSIQGEGFYSGQAAIFIRFSGCNLRCPFCDTKHEDGDLMTADEIIETMAQWPCSFVALTGGEPSLFVDKELVDRLHDGGYRIAMETNGTNNVDALSIDFITLSPKTEYDSRHPVRQTTADELKLVFTSGCDPERMAAGLTATHRFLQPCDTGDTARNAAIIAEMVDYILAHPHWRVSLQIQKIINVR